MAIKFKCPECGATLVGTPEMVGRKIKCAKCGAIFPMPDAADAPPPPPEPKRESESEDEDPYPLERRGRGSRSGGSSSSRSGRSSRDRDDDDDDPRPRPRRRRRDDDDDDDEEPRRRRRRPYRPARGGGGWGAGTWVAIVLGTLLLGGCGCCAGGYFLLPGEQWRRHTSPDGGFAVDLPAAPQKDPPIPGFVPEPGQKVEGAFLWRRGEVYLVMYGPRAPAGAFGETDEQALDRVVRELKADPEFKIGKTKSVTVSDFPGREIEAKDKDGNHFLMRVILSDQRVYVLVGGGQFSGTNSPNVRRFLDSFEVTDRTRPNPRLR